jgi:glucan phosphoethanolaminetransferase (alkaline phosphatase superfamily)
MFFIDKFLLLAYLVAVFALNLFVYMIAEYYRKMVDKRLNPIGFVISMCAISVAVGASFIEDTNILSKIMTIALSVASVASVWNGVKLQFIIRKNAKNNKNGGQ